MPTSPKAPRQVHGPGGPHEVQVHPPNGRVHVQGSERGGGALPQGRIRERTLLSTSCPLSHPPREMLWNLASPRLYKMLPRRSKPALNHQRRPPYRGHLAPASRLGFRVKPHLGASQPLRAGGGAEQCCWREREVDTRQGGSHALAWPRRGCIGGRNAVMRRRRGCRRGGPVSHRFSLKTRSGELAVPLAASVVAFLFQGAADMHEYVVIYPPLTSRRNPDRQWVATLVDP